MSKSYLVIGSNCFTGSHIVDRLLADSENTVVGVSRSPEYHEIFLPYKRHAQGRFQFQQLDITREFERLMALLEKIKPETVINVAALSEVGLSNERPVEYFEANTLAVVRLCHALSQQSFLKRYVHISSAEIFGSCEKPVDEQSKFNPSTPYAVSKAAADMYLNVLLKNKNFPVTIIRTTNVYGRHQQLFKIIPRVVINIKQDKMIELHGGGQAIKSFVHIRDVVEGIVLALEKGTTGTYHFSVPNNDTVAQVVGFVCKLMKRDMREVTRIVPERLGQDARYWLDCKKAQKELGWFPQVSFEEGVREVIEWIESNWEQVKVLPHHYQHKVASQPSEVGHAS